MIKKNVPAIDVMYASQLVTIPEVSSVAERLCPAMVGELESLGLEPGGPFMFVCHGMPRDRETRFPLEICIPAARPAHYSGAYRFKKLASFDCASVEFQGPLSQLFSHGYAPLMAELQVSGDRLSGQSREVYLEWHEPQSQANRVELQIGLVSGGAPSPA